MTAATTMTVGVDVSPLGCAHTGIARYTYELVAALQTAWPDGRVMPVGNRSRVPLPRPATGDGPAVRGPRFPFRSAWTFGLLPFWLPAAGLDVFHATGYYAPIGARMPALVVTVHDLSTFARPDLHPRTRVLRARSVLPLVARRAAAVIVPSRFIREEAIRRLGVRPERVHVVPEAPAELFSRPVGDADVAATLTRYRLDPEFLLAVGTLEPRKNLGRVAEALRIVAGRGAAVPALVVAGPAGWKFGSVEEELRRSGMAEHIHFLGFVPDADLRLLMAAARGLVYPSLYEGFGLPVVEAMAAGLPVITSNSTALAELGESAALLVDPNDGEAMAVAIGRLFDDEDLRRRLSQLGRVRAAEYSWQRTAGLTLDVYRAAAGRSEAAS